MTNEQLIKTYTSDILDLIYNFKPDAWKYLSEEQQKVLNEFKQRLCGINKTGSRMKNTLTVIFLMIILAAIAAIFYMIINLN